MSTSSSSAVGSFAAYLLVLAALRLAAAPAVSAVRETGVVVATILAVTVFLREHVTRSDASSAPSASRPA